MWNISCLHSFGVLQVQSTGEMDAAGIEKMSFEVLTALINHDFYRSLIDLSQVVPQLSRGEIYDLVERLEQLGMRRTCKVALIRPTEPEYARSIALFRQLVVKRGFMFSIFDCRAEALLWLSEINGQQSWNKKATHYNGQCFDAMLAPVPLVSSNYLQNC